jgi:hypothetical protein
MSDWAAAQASLGLDHDSGDMGRRIQGRRRQRFGGLLNYYYRADDRTASYFSSARGVQREGRNSLRPTFSGSGRLLGFETETALQNTAGLSRFVHALVSARISHDP